LSTPAAPVPLVIVGGYLGAGKTTLVNHLLRHAGGRRIAVLVNDFGSVSIDASLIVGSADGVLALAGGCVCCAYGADLIGTLTTAVKREPTPHVVLVECSGVGLPAAVARTAALAPGVAIDGIEIGRAHV
jgi:G3E family GTPase